MSSNTRITVEGAKDVYGLVLPLGSKDEPRTNLRSGDYKNRTLGIKVIENNITNDVDQIINPADNESIINMLVPKNLKTEGGKGNLKSITPLNYHKEIEKYFSKNITFLEKNLYFFSFFEKFPRIVLELFSIILIVTISLIYYNLYEKN